MIARTVRRLSVPILLFWLGLAAVTNIVVPQLEAVGEAHAVSMNPEDAPAVQAMKRVGQVFREFDSDSAVMVVLEGQTPLGDAAQRFYGDLIRKLAQDHKHVEHIQDFWGDPLTAAGSQSADGKAAYVQVFLAGRQGETLANESVDAVRRIVSNVQAPNGIRAYVAGPAAVTTDELEFGNKSARKVMGVTVGVIVLMLLIVYRSLVTVLLTLLMVFIELPAVQGVIAFLGSHGILGLSTFAVQILPILAIAAGTDYAIFVVGRYQEARQAGEEREAAYYTMFRGSAHVVLGSGLTIAGAMFCLSFTRLPYFQTLGAPCAIGMFTMVAGALTLGPACAHEPPPHQKPDAVRVDSHRRAARPGVGPDHHRRRHCGVVRHLGRGRTCRRRSTTPGGHVVSADPAPRRPRRHRTVPRDLAATAPAIVLGAVRPAAAHHVGRVPAGPGDRRGRRHVGEPHQELART